MHKSATHDGSEDASSRIKQMFEASGPVCRVPLLRAGSFKASLKETGVEVDNLGTQSLLPWRVFDEACLVMRDAGGRAKRGDAMNSRLGEDGLPLDSIEGHVAARVYDKQSGDSVFRRITPIVCILVWAGICRAHEGEVSLKVDE